MGRISLKYKKNSKNVGHGNLENVVYCVFEESQHTTVPIFDY